MYQSEIFETVPADINVSAKASSCSLVLHFLREAQPCTPLVANVCASLTTLLHYVLSC